MSDETQISARPRRARPDQQTETEDETRARQANHRPLSITEVLERVLPMLSPNRRPER